MKNYIKKIIDCKFNIPNFVSELGKDLIKRILVTNPNLRFNINQIKNHPWFYLYRKNGRNLVYEGLINTIVIPIEYDVNLTDTLICLLKFRNLNAAKKHFAFIFTDGLFSNLGEKEHIKNYIPQIEESGVSLFGIGLGFYPRGIKDIFGKCSWTLNPHLILNGISKLLDNEIKIDSNMTIFNLEITKKIIALI